MNTVRKSLTALALLACAWPLSAQTANPPSTAGAPPAKTEKPLPAANAAKLDDVIELTPFEVSSTRDTGYQATETLAGTRLRTDLKDVGAAISVYTKDFLNDIGATGSGSLLQYTTNTEVAGSRGTYLGLGNGTTLDENSSLRAPSGAQRVRGLAAADNTSDYFVTDVPWDSYNTNRIDILRGPNSFLFGLGSPAGIVNATLSDAEFRNKGSVEMRVGSYGSWRASINVNQELIHNVLAIEAAGLKDDQRYEQKQAHQDTKRGYAAVRYDPRLFKDPSARTSIKLKFENGDIGADRPRTLAPYDSITPWFAAAPNGLGKYAVSNGYAIGPNPQNISPWLIGDAIANQQQPIWFVDGKTNQLYQIYGGYVNNGIRNSNGNLLPVSGSLPGQNYSSEFFGVNSYNAYATTARLANSGQYRAKSLTDPSIFDFYNTLIDGPTKNEWEHWNTANIDVSQTFWNDRLGIDLAYDHQQYNRGGQSLLGSPTINIDILQQFQDLSANPNFGRPDVIGGPGSGSSYRSDRKTFRAQLFGEVRPEDFIKSSFLLKLLGRQRLNGVYSDDKYYNQNLSWQMYANSQAWDGYWNRNTGNSDSFSTRAPVEVIYLGSSLANASSASGARISGITAPVTIPSGNVYHFNSTWTNPAGVNFGDPWTVPANLAPVYNGTTLTQASNPANYVGWGSGFQNNVLSYNNGQDPTLLTKAQQSLRETKSWAGSYQGYFLQDAIIATLGWRYDEVSTKDVTAQQQSLNRSILDLTPQNYKLPDTFPASQIKKGHSTTESFVFNFNKLLKRDPLPVDIGFTFTNANNFQVTSIRRDLYGNPLADPTGGTRDYGLWLSTKNGKFSLRVVKYKTTLTNNDSGLSGISFQIGSLVQQGLKWRNVFLYQLGNYPFSSANQPSYRNTWTNAYPAETAAQAQAEEDAAITGWNNIQIWLAAKGFFQAWNFNPTTQSALTTRTNYVNNPSAYQPDPATVYAYSAVAPQGFTATADTVSEGYEYEFTFNPLPNWRIAFNAAETTAVRTNFGGPVLDEFTNYMKSQLVNADGTPTAAGKLPQFGGAGNSLFLQQWSQFYGQYSLLKAQQGAAVPELRKWRFNFITNYTFNRGTLKGVGIGGGYRWQDKSTLGYPVNADGTYNIAAPYHGPSEASVDLWASYERKVTKKINWKIQANVRNAFAKDGLIPVSIEPDGSWASARTKPIQEWFVTNTFSF